MSESPEALAIRIRHRLKWVESLYDRKIMTDVLSLRCPHCSERMVEGENGLPVIPHPDGSADVVAVETNGSDVEGFTPERVIEWLEANNCRLVPWQRQRLFRL